jgi:hypothetical protein
MFSQKYSMYFAFAYSTAPGYLSRLSEIIMPSYELLMTFENLAVERISGLDQSRYTSKRVQVSLVLN